MSFIREHNEPLITNQIRQTRITPAGYNHVMKLLYFLAFLFTSVLCAPVDNEPPVTHFVYFQLKQGEDDLGTIKLGLFGSVAPRTAKNFYTIATTTGDQSYTGTIFHRVIDQFMIQGGDYENENGTGGKSIYGDRFEDENFHLKHDRAGRLSMANAGPNTNGAQFFITTVVTAWLDGHHVVFGQVLEGMDIVNKIQKTPVNSAKKPDVDIKIVKSWGEPNKEVTYQDAKEYDEEQVPDVAGSNVWFIVFAIGLLVIGYAAAKYYKVIGGTRYASLRD